MKWMKKLRLINWHYFIDETMEIGRQTLISGQNGAGKSTIIDALQVLFVADQRLIRFNSSAHNEARRTLINYLRGKIGSEEKAFLRDGDFTSYIVAEFRDEQKRESFVIGAVIDVLRDQSYEEEYFIINQIKLEEIEFINSSGYLRNREEFRKLYGQSGRNRAAFERNKTGYKKALLARMGQMHDRFFSIFTKAISFKPIQNIREFVYDYILDQRELQLEVMKQNFEIHENYRREMEHLQERKDRLQEICSQFETCIKWKETTKTQDYVVRRLKYIRETEVISEFDVQIAKINEQISILDKELKFFSDKEKAAQEETQKAYFHWQNNDIKRKKEELDETISRLKSEIIYKNQMLKEFQEKLKKELLVLEKLYGWEDNEYLTFEDTERSRLEETCIDIYDILGDGNRIPEEKAEVLKKAGQVTLEIWEKFSQTKIRLDNKIGELQKEKEELDNKIQNLMNRQRPYPPSVTNLKNLLQERFAGRSPVYVFCEEAEIEDEAWRNAIEGYLHTQKFDLLVEPQLFAEALALYEKAKWQHGLEGVGLVDTEKEARYLGTMEKGSLAETMQAVHPIIKARIEHLLGRVMKAADEQELRRYQTALTTSCMSYQNLVARQIPRKRYDVPYIGSQALVRQLEICRNRLAEVNEALQLYLELQRQTIQCLNELSGKQAVFEKLADQVALPEEITEVRAQMENKEKELRSLDFSIVEQLEKDYLYWKGQFDDFNQKVKDTTRQLSEHNTEIKHKNTEKSLQDKKVKDTLSYWEHWTTEYGAEEGLLQKAESRWLDADKQQLSTEKKIENWWGSFQGNQTRITNESNQLWKLRSSYNSHYGFAGSPEAEDNIAYQERLNAITGVDIPQYQQKLMAALQESEEEFKSHFIYKMREAIEMAKREFVRLNFALKNFPFHEDNYHFEVKASDRYRKFYDVIMDPNLVEKGSIFDVGADQKTETLHELFDLLIRGEAGDQEEFTDYRRYLDFDIVVQSRGSRYSFSQVLKEKSGGETQTPFYIAILASFHHLYSSDKTMRLVVFDEAFNKMDEQRIQTSLRLIKQMNLQLIAAVPDEKMQHMVPEVTTTLLVNNVDFRCFVDMIERNMYEDDSDGNRTREKVATGQDILEQDSIFTA